MTVFVLLSVDSMNVKGCVVYSTTLIKQCSSLEFFSLNWYLSKKVDCSLNIGT